MEYSKNSEFNELWLDTAHQYLNLCFIILWGGGNRVLCVCFFVSKQFHYDFGQASQSSPSSSLLRPILVRCKQFLSLMLYGNASLNMTNGFLIPNVAVCLRHLISYLQDMTVDDSSFLTQFTYLGLDVNTILISVCMPFFMSIFLSLHAFL